MDSIKSRLSEELKNSGLTTVEIAKRVGVSPEMITQYKTTKKLPKLDTFAKLCKELDLSADEILGIKWFLIGIEWSLLFVFKLTFYSVLNL